MFENATVAQLVNEGRPTGEVVGVNRALVRVRGLSGVAINSVVVFANGNQGLVRSIDGEYVYVMHLGTTVITIGMVVVVQSQTCQVLVGDALMGRMIDTLGRPIDSKGPIHTSEQMELFTTTPGITQRTALNTQLLSGVSVIDAMFPLVLGQRMAILGDNKSGKTSFLTQLAANQVGTDHIIVYVMVAKRPSEIDAVAAKIRDAGVEGQTIIVAADSFSSLTHAYLAPYVGCAIAEYFWRQGRHAIAIYDDLTSHAKVYRELSLLAGANPGRSSYPGNMFFSHSSLLERAGCLKDNEGSLTALPVVSTPGDDITAYLPTNIMSITDGQIIFDLETFRKGIRPAVNVGLSVSRVGGRVQDAKWKTIADNLFRKLSDYRRAAEFAQFGSEMSAASRADLELGRQLYQVFKQLPHERYSLHAQYVILKAILLGAGQAAIDIPRLKALAAESAQPGDANTDWDALAEQTLKITTVQTFSPEVTV